MDLEEIIEALSKYDFECDNCGIREKCNKGYYCLMNEAVDIVISKLEQLDKNEDDLK